MNFKLVLMSYLSARLKSFKYAFEGLAAFFKQEAHAKIHLASAVLAIAISLYCGLNKTEWLFVLLAIALVFISEMINTCVEHTLNLIKPDYDRRIKTIKDVAAASVLIAVIFALIVACTIILPKGLRAF